MRIWPSPKFEPVTSHKPTYEPATSNSSHGKSSNCHRCGCGLRQGSAEGRNFLAVLHEFDSARRSSSRLARYSSGSLVRLVGRKVSLMISYFMGHPFLLPQASSVRPASAPRRSRASLRVADRTRRRVILPADISICWTSRVSPARNRCEHSSTRSSPRIGCW
jgi:hypothetical protein